MNRSLIAILATVLLAASAAAVQPLKGQPGFRDPDLFARMPGYYLSERSSFKESQFDAYQFTVMEGSPCDVTGPYTATTLRISRDGQETALHPVRSTRSGLRPLAPFRWRPDRPFLERGLLR
jgi:hypothetical protein